MQSPSTATRRPAKRWTMPRRVAGSKAADMRSTLHRARRGGQSHGVRGSFDRLASALLVWPAMSTTIAPCRMEDLERVRGLITHPSLEGEFSTLALPGVLEDSFEDPYADLALRALAIVDGVAVGYAFTLVLPSS